MRAQQTTAGAARAGLTCLILLAGLLTAGCAGGRANTGMITVTLDKPAEDTATVSVEDGRAVIDVTSPSGIGGLTAVLGGGNWPDEVVVRLRDPAFDHFIAAPTSLPETCPCPVKRRL